MAKDRVTICIQSEVDQGELYFKEEDEKLLQKLREKAAKEASESYRADHEYHCFRCGTKSLVEIDRGDIKIDMCTNEGCGAVHLDPGELDQILQNEQSIGAIRKTFLSVFKK